MPPCPDFAKKKKSDRYPTEFSKDGDFALSQNLRFLGFDEISLSFEKEVQNSLLYYRNKSQFVTLKENLKPEEFNSSLGSQVFSPLRDVSAVGSPNISSMTPVSFKNL